MKFVLFALVVATGCASGGSGANNNNQVDAAVSVDAKVIDSAPLPDTPPPIDSPVVDTPPPIDAPPDMMTDAQVMADASMPDACVPITTQLLANPVFDLTPVGTGWTQTVIDPMYPLITDQDGIAEQTAPYKAWMGGIPSSSGSVTDVLYQDVVVPANTTQLVLTGFYEVRSGEDPTDLNVYDTASIGFTQTSGTPIVTVNSYSNLTPTTTWTAINYTFTQNMSGQTIRLRMTSSNDFLNATSFYFDSFALNATHCP